MTHPLHQTQFRRISASTVIASEKVQLSWIGSRLRAFQWAMDEVRTLPLTPQRVAQKANLSFKNRLLYISLIDEASDFKFGKQLGFAHHQISLGSKNGCGPGLGELPKIWGSPSIFTHWLQLGISNLVHSLVLPRPTTKPHSEDKWAWPCVRESPIHLGVPL